MFEHAYRFEDLQGNPLDVDEDLRYKVVEELLDFGSEIAEDGGMQVFCTHTYRCEVWIPPVPDTIEGL